MASIELIKEEDIKRLERIKELIKEILELDNGFSLSNIIEVDNEDTLIFTTDVLWKEDDFRLYENYLTDNLKCKCVILRKGIELNKAITKRKIDYETKVLYSAEGIIKEETTTQYI